MVTDEEVIALSRAESGRDKSTRPPKVDGASRSSRRYYFRKKIIRERKAKPCTDCGHEYPWFCMEFDHRDPSQKLRQQGKSRIANISDAMRRLNCRAFLEELDKCDVVCVICARMREFTRGMYQDV